MNKNRIFLSVLFAAVFCISSFAQTPSMAKRTTTKTDRFDFGAGGTIAITGSPTGSIKVIGTSKNEFEITAEIEVQGATEADVAKLADLTGFLLDETPNRIGVISVGNHNKFGAKKLPKDFPKNLLTLPYTINYVLSVPRYSDLEIDGGIGDLSVTGVEGSMRINFVETKAHLEVVGGATYVTVANGTVDVAFGVRGWRGRAADIKIGTGDLNVRLPSNMSSEIDATILKSGSIENALPDLKPRDRKAPFTEKSIAAKAGVGGAALSFTVADGKIKIERLVLPL